MRNQSPLSPAQVLYEELLENEDAGSLDTWPERRSSTTSHGDMDRIKPANPDATHRIEQIRAVDGIADDDSIQPRSALAAIIRLQATEIERLALENDRLAERLDAVDRLLEDERKQRRELDQKRQEASLRNPPPAPALDVEEIRRAAREGMSAEIKPVLMAILDLLETTLSGGAETVRPTAGVGGAPGSAPGSAPANLMAEVIDDFRRLPDILTRPIEELTSGAGNPRSTPNHGADADPPARSAPQKTRMHRPRPPRHRAQPSAIPSVFAWTNLFS